MKNNTMKTLLSLSALLITLTLTAQSNTATWYLNDTSGNGIQDINANASGSHSFAMGDNANSSGFNSRALGILTTASGEYSTAMGFQTLAIGSTSIAMGYGSVAEGNVSTSMGEVTLAKGTASTAMGRGTKANGNYSTTMGYGAIAEGNSSTAMGIETGASGTASTAMGQSTKASGYASTTMGYSTIASDTSSLVIGEYNLLGSTVTNSATEFSTENTAFVIGNGTANESRSDALTVLFDGTTTIAGDLSINSDARLKANIISLGSTLAKLLQIDGKSYTMKKDENKKQKIGVLAQDIEKVFPELVSESKGVKSVNYQGLVPVLINALKEQDSKMNEQEKKLNKQQAEIDELKAIVNKLITP